MKHIDTLIEDIYGVVTKGADLSDDMVRSFGDTMASVIKDALSERSGTYLRVSNLGSSCDRELWLQINRPEVVEPFKPEDKMKFLIGHVIEAVVLLLAEAAGHDVQGKQDEIEINGVKGHRDAVIDGVVVDVKSASPYSFDKFKEGIRPENDAFGYLDQLGAYLEAGQLDNSVLDKERAAFLAVHKVLGKLVLDFHERRDRDYSALVEQKKEMLANDKLPNRGYSPVPSGKSGNMALGVHCSYCRVKHTCYPNLRTFLYASGPVYLVDVVKEPNVTEVL